MQDQIIKIMSNQDLKSIHQERGVKSVNTSRAAKRGATSLASKHVLDGQSCIIAEQNGLGETLAYLAPLVHRLKEAMNSQRMCIGRHKALRGG